VDEIHLSNKNELDQLKMIITEKKERKRKMRADTEMEEGSNRLVASTNHIHDSLPSEAADRRFFAHDVNLAPILNHPIIKSVLGTDRGEALSFKATAQRYVRAILSDLAMDDNLGYRTLYNFFMQVKIPQDWHPEQFPNTRLIVEQKIQYLDPAPRWWLSCLTRGNFMGDLILKKKLQSGTIIDPKKDALNWVAGEEVLENLFLGFKSSAAGQGKAHKIDTPTALLTALRPYLPASAKLSSKVVNNRNVTYLHIPSLMECKRAMADVIKGLDEYHFRKHCPQWERVVPPVRKFIYDEHGLEMGLEKDVILVYDLYGKVVSRKEIDGEANYDGSDLQSDFTDPKVLRVKQATAADLLEPWTVVPRYSITDLTGNWAYAVKTPMMQEEWKSINKQLDDQLPQAKRAAPFAAFRRP
jgi:hypothetical protein